MNVDPPRFVTLPRVMDARGVSVPVSADVLALLGVVRDIHIASVVPGAVRGNHYHVAKTELIAVSFDDAWSFTWDTGEGTAVESREFTGAGAVAVLIGPHAAHAVCNTGGATLTITVISDAPYDPGAPEAVVRRIS